MIAFVAALLAQLEVEEIRPLTPYYKKGVWVPVIVTVRSSAGGEFELEARTDARIRFVRRITVPSNHRATVVIPVLFVTGSGTLSVGGKRYTGPLKHVHPSDLVLVGPTEEQPAEIGGRTWYQSKIVPGEEKYLEPYGEGIDAALVAGKPQERTPVWTAGGGQFVQPQIGETREVVNRGSLPMFDRALVPLARGLPAPKIKTIAAYKFVALYFLACALAGAAALKMGRRLLPVGIGVVAAFTAGFFLRFPRALVAQYEHTLHLNGGAARIYVVDSPRDETLALEFPGLVKPLVDAGMTLEVTRDRTVVRDVTLRRGAPMIFVGWSESSEAPRAKFADDKIRNLSDRGWRDVMLLRPAGMAYFGRIPPGGEAGPRQGEFPDFAVDIAARFVGRERKVFGTFEGTERVAETRRPGYTLEIHRGPDHFLTRAE